MQDTQIMTGEMVDVSMRRALFFGQMSFIIPVTVLSLFLLSAIFAPVLAPYSPTKVSLTERLLPPFFVDGGSTAHILGTDKLGRDVLSRVIFGTRISLSISLIVVFITSSFGTILGIISGYLGGRIDATLMRVTDVSMAFPAIILALLLAVIIGPSFLTVVLAMSILGWAPYARLIRGEALRLRGADFVDQARIIGSSSLRIMVRHIFPNIINPLIIMMTLMVGIVILLEAGLSFIGVGIPPPTPSWGVMVSDGRNLVSFAWWISFFPGMAIGMVVLSGNFLGDWLRDRLDPRLRQV
jgi:peptide/nickel transport system permease protein